METQAPPARAHRRRPLFHAIVYTLIGMALLVALLPQLVGMGVRYALINQGIGHVTLENVDINLPRGSIAFDNLRLYRSAAQLLHLRHGEAQIDWSALWQKRLHLTELTLEGLSFTVEQPRQGALRIAGLLMPEPAQQPSAERDADPSGWSFGIDNVRLEDNALHLIRPGHALTLNLNHFETDRLHSWQPEQPTTLKAALSLNDANLELNTSATPLATEPGAEFTLRLVALPLSEVQPFLPELDITGSLYADLSFTLESEAEQLNLNQRGSLHLAQPRLKLAGQTLSGERLDWQSESQLQLGKSPLTIKLNRSRLTAERLALQRPDLQLTGEALSWQGRGRLQQGPDSLSANLEQGELSLQAFVVQQEPLALHGGPLSWHASGTLNQSGDTLQAALTQSQLNLERFSLEQPDLQLVTGPLDWRTRGELSRRKADTEVRLDHETLQLETVALTQPARVLRNDRLRWQGESRLSLTEEGLKTTLNGALHSTVLALTEQTRNLQLNVGESRWSGKTVVASTQAGLDYHATGALRLKALTAGETDAEAPHTHLALTELSDITVAADALTIEQLRLADLQTALTLTADGVQPLARHSGTTEQETGSDAEQASTTEDRPMAFRLGGLRLEGSNRLRFEDRSVEPAFVQTLSPQLLTLGALDSRQPQQPTPLSLDATLDDQGHSRLTLNGTITPLSRPPALSLEGRLKNYEMLTLSPYLVRQLGYRVNRGQLDSEAAINIADNRLKGQIILTARQLQMTPEDPARIKAFEKKSNMPINTALNLLRDKQNNIHLTVPISGQLNDPQFDFSDAINTALAAATKSAAVSYIKYLLQPYGSVITLVQLAGKVGGGVRLEPVTFDPGSATLTPEAIDYNEKLAQLFQKRDGFQLLLCGYATTSDLSALTKRAEETIPEQGHEALEKLARERAERIKQHLISEHRIDADRLYICHPALDRAEAAIPRVELQL
ncbi:MAG: DUF748 domain-containing protein [Pseudomonadota bacterium]